MKRPDPKVVKALALTTRQFPEVYKWIEGWYRQELEQLPSVGQNVALAQGRCQVLKELHDLMRKSPDLAAESHRDSCTCAHR
jgi:hypothetical protein